MYKEQIMRKYDVEGLGIQALKTNPSEITLKEFKQIVKLQSENKGDYTYYLDTFEVLGLSTEYTDIMTSKELILTIKDFQEDFVVKGMQSEITIEGYTYKSFDGDEFSLTARELANIENEMKHSDIEWISYALALIFKRVDLTINEHKDKVHIKQKIKLFEEHMTMDIALPYIVHISGEYLNNIKILTSIN